MSLSRCARLKGLLRVWHNQAVLGETEFRLNGELGELRRLAANVAHFCRAQAVGQDVEFNLNLVLEELFVNALEHGGCKGMPDAVEVHLSGSRGTLQVEFADRGAPFDSSLAGTPQLNVPLAQRAAGGLGLHFVQQLARGLAYRRQGSWNRLTFILPNAETDTP